ncbi:hypothetical protein ACFPZ0_11310 [Streptomonospora nanhaiensis]|uniref:Uncharacterized protein n=1 Tax=Streptomonospora nanhaiensis TaxID=1323731 RepID=A0A853BU78_9ACTN|nr:hypothetical protein [Streptomonospora nanhaiensis]MBV2365999.1 hypothetical protein [Streptomonospora nanhaiensis]MBX9388820.1 hypothetical protein [Streptomonospora nanhaiensis]NYI98316.1 hypothetical protein [Streptomonospora nanhaiensis]
MSDFPENYLSRAAEAPLKTVHVAAAHFNGPGAVIVYDSPQRRYRTVAPGDRYHISEPEQVIVCGYGDIQRLLADYPGDDPVDDLTKDVAADALRHLTAWAHTERLAGLAPITTLRRAMNHHGFYTDRRSDLGRTEEGALTTTDHFIHSEAHHLTVVIDHLATAGATTTRVTRVRLLDGTTEIAAWNGTTRPDTACGRACEISAAAHRYLGH